MVRAPKAALAWVVDLLPRRLWRPGNLHLFGEHSLHFCVEDGRRTIEWDGFEIARGRRSSGPWLPDE